MKDTGTGIDSEIMLPLFTKFGTKSDSINRYTVTGLGLYISKSIIEAAKYGLRIIGMEKTVLRSLLVCRYTVITINQSVFNSNDKIASWY